MKNKHEFVTFFFFEFRETIQYLSPIQVQVEQVSWTHCYNNIVMKMEIVYH